MLKHTMIIQCMLLLVTVTLTRACTCALPKHPQEHFCNSDFVLHVFVLNRTENMTTYDATYHVTVLDVLKEPEVFSNFNPPTDADHEENSESTIDHDDLINVTTEAMMLEPTTSPVPRPFNTVLHTALWGSLCGVYLEEHKLYILGGNINNGELFINLCGLHILDDEKSLNKRQKAGFFRKYKHHCDCSIAYCNKAECPAVTDDQCSVQSGYSFFDFMDCANRYSMCKRRSGKCQWTKNRKHTTCQNQALRKRIYKQ